MKKLILTLSLLTFFSIKAQAVSVSDIPTIQNVAAQLLEDVVALQQFGNELANLANKNFVLSAGGVVNKTLTNQDKADLLTQYQVIKAKMTSDFALLP